MGYKDMGDPASPDLIPVHLDLRSLTAIYEKQLLAMVTNCEVGCLSCIGSAELFPSMVTASMI